MSFHVVTLVGSLSAAPPQLMRRPWVLGLPALSVKHLETKATRFYCFQKGPPAVPGQQPGPAPAAPAECPPSTPKLTLPVRRFAEAGGTRSPQHRPFPPPQVSGKQPG